MPATHTHPSRILILATILCTFITSAALAQTPIAVTGQNGTETVVVRDLGAGISRVIPLEAMPTRRMANGGESRDALKGTLPSGIPLSVHESVLEVGMAPNPVHAVEHAEIITILDGRLEFLHDGRADIVGKGGVLYVAQGSHHTMRNIGTGPVRYVVVAIGGDAAQ